MALAEQERKGTLAAIACYVFWGLCPIYWKLLGNVSSVEIICHRIIWCFVIVVAVCFFTKAGLRKLLREKRAWSYLVPSSILITINWSLYIYAVATGHIVDTALGYYINPLVSILFGIVFFKERLTPLQIIAVVLCAVGILFFTFSYGVLPWIALVLALTFGAYGAVKKKAGYAALPALAFENTVLIIPVLICTVAFAFFSGSHAFLGDVATASGWATTLLLVGAGFVTATPLLLFAHAANNIPLSLLGFIQYLSPTLALLSGVFLYGEAFTFAHIVCFGCIWTGLALVAVDALRPRAKVSADK